MKILAFSGGKDSMACLHLLKDELDAAIYVDTGYSYPETQRLVEYAGTLVKMIVVQTDLDRDHRVHGLPADVVPVDWTLQGQVFTDAKEVTIQGYFECCYRNIAIPIVQKALDIGAKEIVYGQRDDDGHKSPAKDGDILCGMVRRHPIANWTEAEVLSYLATKMDVPDHYKIKHSSLDCYICTGYRKDSHDRIEWTKSNHPAFHAAYMERKSLLDRALNEAMQ